MDALTVRPESTALMIVDVQDKLVAAMPEHDARRMLACVELLTETARLLQLPVFVTEHYPKGLGRTVESVRVLLDQHEAPARIVEKTIFSAMGPAAVPRALAATGRRAVVVVGMEAHVCAFQTARDLHSRGYFVHVPFDAVASRDPACKQTALAALGRHGVTVTTTETVVFDLLQHAGHEHFRALSKRVKDLPLGR